MTFINWLRSAFLLGKMLKGLTHRWANDEKKKKFIDLQILAAIVKNIPKLSY